MRHLTHRGPPSAGSESGATATEYLFLMVFIALVIVAGAVIYGGALADRYDSAADGVTNAS